jgi:Flp pilus assembly pilin Flp
MSRGVAYAGAELMTRKFARFVADQRGTTFEGIALSVAIIAVAFVASADMLDYMVKKHLGEGTVAVATKAPATSDLDETPTASLPKLVTRSVLDPCTGVVK